MKGKLASKANDNITPGVKTAATLKVSISPSWLPVYVRINNTGIIPSIVASVNKDTLIEVKPRARLSV